MAYVSSSTKEKIENAYRIRDHAVSALCALFDTRADLVYLQLSSVLDCVFESPYALHSLG